MANISILGLIGIVTVLVDGALSTAEPNLRCAEHLIEIIYFHLVESTSNSVSTLQSFQIDLHRLLPIQIYLVLKAIFGQKIKRVSLVLLVTMLVKLVHCSQIY